MFSLHFQSRGLNWLLNFDAFKKLYFRIETLKLLQLSAALYTSKLCTNVIFVHWLFFTYYLENIVSSLIFIQFQNMFLNFPFPWKRQYHDIIYLS